MNANDDGEFSKLELLIEQLEETQEKIARVISNLIIDRALSHKQQLALSTYQQATIQLNKSIADLKEKIAVGKFNGRY